MSGWATSSLSDVTDLVARGISPKYIDDAGVRVVNQRCVRDHEVDYASARRHDADAKPIRPDRLVRAGDVLVNSTGVGTLGRVAQVRREPSEPTTVDTHVTIVRPRAGLFHPEFFGYVLQSIEPALTEAGEGASGQTELSRTTLAGFEVTYPTSLDEQKRIVAILDQAFAGIAKATTNATQNLSNAGSILNQVLDHIVAPQSDDCEEYCLGEVCDLFQGLAINAGTKHLLVPHSDLPLLRIRDLRDGTAEQFVSASGYPVNALVGPEDILYTRTGQIGLVFRGRYGILHNNCFKISPRRALDNDFLYWWLQSPKFRNEIFRLSSRAAQPDITHKIFKAQIIRLPPIKEQKRLARRVAEISGSISELEAHYRRRVTELGNLKEAILHKAFSGQLTSADNIPV